MLIVPKPARPPIRIPTRRIQGRTQLITPRQIPPTPRQRVVRQAFTLASKLYSSLPAPQRFVWRAYAAQVPMCCRFRINQLTTGQRWFIGSTSERLRVQDTATLLDVPLVFTRTDTEAVLANLTRSPDRVIITHLGIAEWYGMPYGRISVYASRSWYGPTMPRWLPTRLIWTARPSEWDAFTPVSVPYPYALLDSGTFAVVWRTRTEDNRYSLIDYTLVSY